MSAGVVILMFRGEPITTATSWPDRSTSDASSVPRKSVRRGFIERLLDHAIAKALRRLRHHNTCARNRRFDQRALGRALDLLHRIDGGQAGNRRSIFLRRLDHFLNDFPGHKWTHRIVHQNNIIRARLPPRSARSPPTAGGARRRRRVPLSCFRTSFASLSSRARNPAISFSRRAIQISLTASTAANLRSVWMRIGVPPSSVNCLEGGDFFCLPLAPTGIGAMRVPSPAAGMITTTFIAGCKYTSAEVGVQMQWSDFQESTQ